MGDVHHDYVNEADLASDGTVPTWRQEQLDQREQEKSDELDALRFAAPKQFKREMEKSRKKSQQKTSADSLIQQLSEEAESAQREHKAAKADMSADEIAYFDNLALEAQKERNPDYVAIRGLTEKKAFNIGQDYASEAEASEILQKAQPAPPKKTFDVGFDYAHEDDVLPKKMQRQNTVLAVAEKATHAQSSAARLLATELQGEAPVRGKQLHNINRQQSVSVPVDGPKVTHCVCGGGLCVCLCVCGSVLFIALCCSCSMCFQSYCSGVN
eukprot:m.780655 g.780655  ORF g.780655 m.780655 type:complete len:270 (+) comp23282_c0_seq14:236-1045(+)